MKFSDFVTMRSTTSEPAPPETPLITRTASTCSSPSLRSAITFRSVPAGHFSPVVCHRHIHSPPPVPLTDNATGITLPRSRDIVRDTYESGQESPLLSPNDEDLAAASADQIKEGPLPDDNGKDCKSCKEPSGDVV